MTISFELDGQPFTALNGGPQFSFTEGSRLLQQTEPQKSQRVMQALLQMKKIDISALERAAT